MPGVTQRVELLLVAYLPRVVKRDIEFPTQPAAILLLSVSAEAVLWGTLWGRRQ